MNALDFACAHVWFDKTSDISGAFDSAKYRMIERPLLDLSNIEIKEQVVYKASGCMGTVFGQIAMAYRVARELGDLLFVAQTDDDAGKWSDTRGKDFLMRIRPVARMIRRNVKYPVTQGRWLFSGKFLIVTGPGVNAQNSDQVRFLQTDEAHLYDAGTLSGFDGRMGDRWMRAALHTTTAPSEGHEIDARFLAGKQNEWHLRCPKCTELVWPLWRDDAKAHYNGEEVFRWTESQSESETLASIYFVCPHCGCAQRDNSITRYEMNTRGDYVAMNPDATIARQSYRWSRFAAYWLSWRDVLAKWLYAVESAKLGDLKPHEEFQKKILCKTYRPEMPDIGQFNAHSDYKVGDVWVIEDSVKILSADYQAGKQGEGSHLWALVTQWDRQGNSRRIAYRRLATWAQLRAMQLEFGVESNNVFVDSGYDNRTVFFQCSLYHWYATRGSDEKELFHRVTLDRGKPTQRVIMVPMPYSQTERQNGNVGAKTPAKLKSNLAGNLPLGWCLSRVMSNPQLYGYLHALQSGSAGREFKIPSDMPKEYLDGFPAFIPVTERSKRTNLATIIWKKVKVFEHPWDCEVQSLMGAMIAGFYPLKRIDAVADSETEEKAA